MAMEESLIARLTGNAAIAALCGSRVAWFGRPRGDGWPCLILSKIEPGRDYDHAGPDGLDAPRVQFDSYATTDLDVLALARAVRAVMETPATIATTRFHIGFIELESNVDAEEMEGGAMLFRITQDFSFMHQEV